MPGLGGGPHRRDIVPRPVTPGSASLLPVPASRERLVGAMLPSELYRRASGGGVGGGESIGGITGERVTGWSRLTGLWRRAGAAGAQCSKAAASKAAAAAAGSGGRTMPGGGEGSDMGRRRGGVSPR